MSGVRGTDDTHTQQDNTQRSMVRSAANSSIAEMALSEREGSWRVRGQRGSPCNVWLIGELRLGYDGRVAQHDGCEPRGALKGAHIELWVDLVLWCALVGCRVWPAAIGTSGCQLMGDMVCP